MTEKKLVQNKLTSTIVEALSSYPDLLDIAVTAITYGMNLALADAERRAGNSQMAMLSALLLAHGKRLSPQLRETLLEKVQASISPENASPIEREWLAK